MCGRCQEPEVLKSKAKEWRWEGTRKKLIGLCHRVAALQELLGGTRRWSAQLRICTCTHSFTFFKHSYCVQIAESQKATCCSSVLRNYKVRPPRPRLCQAEKDHHSPHATCQGGSTASAL